MSVHRYTVFCICVSVFSLLAGSWVSRKGRDNCFQGSRMGLPSYLECLRAVLDLAGINLTVGMKSWNEFVVSGMKCPWEVESW